MSALAEADDWNPGKEWSSKENIHGRPSAKRDIFRILISDNFKPTRKSYILKINFPGRQGGHLSILS